MQPVLIGLAVFALGASAVQAQTYAARPQPQPGQTQRAYDWQSGNRTTTTQNYDGTATVRGNNTNTGATWRTTIQPNGNQRGTDSEGNSWSYNRATGSYYNSNGTTCTGRGAARVCN